MAKKMLLKLCQYLNKNRISDWKLNPVDPFVTNIEAVSHLTKQPRIIKEEEQHILQGGDILIGIPVDSADDIFYFTAVGLYHKPVVGDFKGQILGVTSAHFFDHICPTKCSFYVCNTNILTQGSEPLNSQFFKLIKFPIYRIETHDKCAESDVAIFGSRYFEQWSDDIKVDYVSGIGNVSIKPQETPNIGFGDVMGVQPLFDQTSAVVCVGLELDANKLGYKNMIGAHNYFDQNIPCVFQGDCGSMYINAKNEVVACHSASMEQIDIYNACIHFSTPVKYIQKALGYPYQTPLPNTLPLMETHKTQYQSTKSNIVT